MKLKRLFHCKICHLNDCEIHCECQKDTQNNKLILSQNSDKANIEEIKHHEMVEIDNETNCNVCNILIREKINLRD